MPKKTAAQRLSEKISRYPKLTQKEVYSRMEEFEITPNKMLKYINATEKYNKNLEIARRKYEKIFTQQFQKMNAGNTKYFSPTKGGNIRITTAGKTARGLYVSNAMEEVAPSQNKGIVPGKTMIENLGFNKILESRQSVGSMKGSAYFDWRNDIYFKNWIKAAREKLLNPEPIITEYEKLSSEEKLAFMATEEGKIGYVYKEIEQLGKIQDIIEQILSTRVYTADEFRELEKQTANNYHIILNTPEYIQDEIDQMVNENLEQLADIYAE